MKKKFIYILLSVVTLNLMTACEDDEDINKEILGLGGEVLPKGPIDIWLYDNFTQPYNISVKYRWDGSEVAADRTLVPPREDKVIPLMETVKQGWIDVYTAEAGEVFVKKLAPKQYVLVGSPQYNTGGTITLGEAEGGNKVTLFRVNDFDKSSRAIVKPILKTIHHEFAHILHQQVSYSKEFPQITPAGYTADWNNTTLANARAAGYITTYAQAAPNEDFAEMVSVMLTEGKAGYETIVKSLPNATAVAAIRKKEELVVAYFKQVWNIEFYQLQNRTTLAINNITSTPALSGYLGFGKTYTSIGVNPSSLEGLSTDFMTVYNSAKAGLLAVNSTAKYNLTGMNMFFNANDEVVLRLSFQATAGTSNGTAYTADFTYKMAVDANQNVTFTYVSRNANANVIANGVAPLTNYLEQNTFKFSWHYSPELKYEYGGLTKANDANSFFFGTLAL